MRVCPHDVEVERTSWRMMILFTGAAAVALAFLVGDFAERVRGRIYRLRGLETPNSGFRQIVTVVLAMLLLGWVVAAYG